MESRGKGDHRLLHWDRISGGEDRQRGNATRGIISDSLAKQFQRVLTPPEGRYSIDRLCLSIAPTRSKTVSSGNVNVQNNNNDTTDKPLPQTLYSPHQRWTRVIFVVLTLFGLLHRHASAQSTAGRKVRRMITAVPPGATVKLNCLLPKDETVSIGIYDG